MLTFIDWLELRLQGEPNVEYLKRLGYNPIFDKGTRSHFHKFETDDFVLMWEIKSPYIKAVYTHLQVKNKTLYREESFLKDSILDLCNKFALDCGLSLENAMVSRIDFAVDVPFMSPQFNLCERKFMMQEVGIGREHFRRYAMYVTKQGYHNYTAGNRASQFFVRLYNKTEENTDIRTGKPLKPYILELHKLNFGDVPVYRLEVEFKPRKAYVSQFNDFIQYYAYLTSRFFDEKVTPKNVYLGDNYEKTLQKFTERDAIALLRMLDKYSEFLGNCPSYVSMLQKELKKFLEGTI